MNNYFNIFPLGDSAATFDLGNTINKDLNRKVRMMQKWLLENSPEGTRDIITGYSSVSLFYDPVEFRKRMPVAASAFEVAKKILEEAWHESGPISLSADEELIRIPVCYDEEFGCDLEFLSRTIQISKEEIIRLHCERTYYIYMIGFLPGFSYMAEVDEKLNVPRKINPVAVAPGSVGISGGQTGIYPLPSPGGWQIIGRTPLKLFDRRSAEPVRLRAGMQVQFYAIGRPEFEEKWQRQYAD